MLKLKLLLLPLLALTPSCIGGWVYTTNHATLVSPTIDPAKPFIIQSTSSAPALTTDFVTELSGRPNKIVEHSPAEQEWIYVRDAQIWHAIFVMLVIVPLPLGFPVGHEQVALRVRDKLVIEARVALQDEHGGAFGLIPTDQVFGTISSPGDYPDDSVRNVGTTWRRPVPKKP